MIADSFKANRKSSLACKEVYIIRIRISIASIYNTLVIHSGVEITTKEVLQHELFWWRSSQYYGAVTGKQGGNDTTRDYFTIYQNLSSVSVNKG
jgi:hypothetical protein